MQLSKKTISKAQWDSWWDGLLKTWGEKKNAELGLLFDVLLPRSEKIMAAKRLMICYLTINGVEPSVIVREIKVSAATVYKYKYYTENNPAFRDILKSVFPSRKSSRGEVTRFEKFFNMVMAGKTGYYKHR